ncbi:MAG: hypothetical protein WKF75_13280 [Singulisphaera sp.]
MRQCLTVAIVVLLGYALALQGRNSSAAPETTRDREADARDIYEAVFRHQFEHNSSAIQKDAKSYFLSVKDKDPSPALLKRFTGHKPPVNDGSKFRTGQGLLFEIRSMKWLGDDAVEVLGGYYEHGLSASNNLYRVERRGARWVVTKDKLKGVALRHPSDGGGSGSA